MKTLRFLVFFFCSFSASAQQKPMTTPTYLQKGDTIAIVAPAGIIKNEASIHQAASLAESWGLHVVLGKNIFSKNNHFAGTDKQRLDDFQQAIDAPTIKAIWCARGGYGTIRIIDKIDFSNFLKKPKWIIGYSDITVLHNHIHSLGIETLHGMMPVNMEFPETLRTESVSTLNKTLFGEKIAYSLPSSSYNTKGECKGVLVGGNLTILENLLGTDSTLDTTNKIVFIEEIGEYKYHIDRLLRALDRNEFFKNCNGIIIGDMSKIKSNTPSYGQTIEELILEIVSPYKIPVVFDFPAGHEPENKALYLGRAIEIKVTDNLSKVNFLN